MDSDLVHPASEGSAEDHAGAAVVAHPLKLGPALLAMGGHLAHPDLVAHHLHWLTTLCLASKEKWLVSDKSNRLCSRSLQIGARGKNSWCNK